MKNSAANLVGTRAACVISQLLLLALFLALGMLRSETTGTLQALDLDSINIEAVAGAFSRYYVWLAVSALIVCGFTVFDLPGREGSDSHDGSGGGSGATGQSLRRSLLIYGGLAFFLFYLILTRCLQFPFAVDDSYIDYRYVRSWVDGTGFDYNPGERVMGFTSHLHLALLSLCYLLARPVELPVISQMLNVAIQVGSYFLAFIFMRRAGGGPLIGLAAAAVLALLPYMTQESIGGKESPLVALLCLGTLYAMERKWLSVAAWLAAMVVLARPEGGLFLILVFFWAALRKDPEEADGEQTSKERLLDALRRFPAGARRALPAFVLPVIALIAFAGWLFGSFGTIIPHGMIGKAHMFYKPFPLMDMVLVLRRLGDGCLVPELIMPLDPLFSYAYDFFRLYGGVLVLLAMLKFFDRGALRFYGIAVLCFWLLFTVANPYLFPWYLCWFALVPPLLVPILLLRIKESLGKGKKGQDRLLVSVAAYLVVCQVIQQPVRLEPGLASVSFFWSGAYQRLLIYRQAALRARVLDPSCRGALAAPEIGVLGYFYPGPILDLGGLVCDEVMKYGPPPPELRRTTELFTIIPAVILELRPRFLVTDGFFGEAGLFKLEEFRKAYRKDRFYPLELWSDGIYLYAREPVPGRD